MFLLSREGGQGELNREIFGRLISYLCRLAAQSLRSNKSSSSATVVYKVEQFIAETETQLLIRPGYFNHAKNSEGAQTYKDTYRAKDTLLRGLDSA